MSWESNIQKTDKSKHWFIDRNKSKIAAMSNKAVIFVFIIFSIWQKEDLAKYEYI